MSVAAAMENVSITEALGLSVLGMIIVFVVLIFLMAIIFVMTAIIRKRRTSEKLSTAAGVAKSPAQPEQLTQTTDSSTLQTSEQDSDSPVSSTSTPAPDPLAVEDRIRTYRVVVGGVEYKVEAEVEETATEEGTPSAPVQAAPATQAPEAPASVPAATPAGSKAFSGSRKFKVVVNGVEYDVGAQSGTAAHNSGN